MRTEKVIYYVEPSIGFLARTIVFANENATIDDIAKILPSGGLPFLPNARNIYVECCSGNEIFLHRETQVFFKKIAKNDTLCLLQSLEDKASYIVVSLGIYEETFEKIDTCNVFNQSLVSFQ